MYNMNASVSNKLRNISVVIIMLVIVCTFQSQCQSRAAKNFSVSWATSILMLTAVIPISKMILCTLSDRIL